MAQYLDKAALVAEIKKLKMDVGNIFNEYDEGFWEGRTTAFDDVICALGILEVKEVDLKKELSTYLEVVKATDEDIDFVDFAKHFFELGIKAQKGE